MLTIISGAQTGVDRGALDAALDNGVTCAGWCPRGRKAEDGVIPEHYPVQELGSEKYTVRTRRNVIDSDGTVIIYFGFLSGGTELTLQYCLNQKKPYLLVDATELTPARTGERIAQFVSQEQITILNFAGPRASSTPQAHDYARNAVAAFLELYLH